MNFLLFQDWNSISNRRNKCSIASQQSYRRVRKERATNYRVRSAISSAAIGQLRDRNVSNSRFGELNTTDESRMDISVVERGNRDWSGTGSVTQEPPWGRENGDESPFGEGVGILARRASHLEPRQVWRNVGSCSILSMRKTRGGRQAWKLQPGRMATVGRFPTWITAVLTGLDIFLKCDNTSYRERTTNRTQFSDRRERR